MNSSTHVSEDVPFPSIDAAPFLVGQDREGRWLAVQTGGKRGGIFTNRDAAVHYARNETERRAGALHFVDAPLRLV